MTTIVTRSGKGSPLTHTEVDTNFTNLNTAKLETAAIPLGTLGAPSISFLSYSTTGIYSPAGDELGVSMLGSDKIRIKSTGEIIINATASRTTLSTTPRLQIEGSSSSNQCSMSLTGAGAGGTLFPRLHLSKARSSVNAIVLEDDILGFISFNGGDGSSLVNAGFIKAEVDGTPSAGIVPGRLVFATVDTAGGSGERMIIKNNGNVSIDGTTFNVDAVNNLVGIGVSSPQKSIDTSGDIRLSSGGSRVIDMLQSVNAAAYTGPGFYSASSMGFGISASGSYRFIGGGNGNTEIMRLTDAGLLGIGSTGPQGNLHIADATRANIIIKKTGLATIDNSTLSTVYDTIQLGAGGSFVSYNVETATADTLIGHNFYRHSGGDFKYKYTDAVARIKFNSSEGETIFDRAASGSANTNITFSESMRIDASGRLLVGTSTSSGAPSSGATIQLADQFSVRAVSGGGVTNQYASTASATTLNCVIDVPIGGNIYSSFIGSLYICQQLTNSEKSFLAEYRVKIHNAGGTTVFTLVDSLDDSSPNNVALTFTYSNANRQITVTSTWTTATSSGLNCNLIGAGAVT